MNLPQFTAEVSLYLSNGDYRTHACTRFVGSSSTRPISDVYHPAQTGDTGTTGNEIIHVTGTAPCPSGYEQQGGQCVPVTLGTLPSGGGTPPSGGGQGSGQQVPPGWTLCPGQATAPEQTACSEWVVVTPGGDQIGGGQIMCDEKGNVFCCIQDGQGSWRCLPPSKLPWQRRGPPIISARGPATWKAVG
jgi:hypothetical protein